MQHYQESEGDDLDTMNNPGEYLDAGEIDAMEEGFIRGFNAAA